MWIARPVVGGTMPRALSRTRLHPRKPAPHIAAAACTPTALYHHFLCGAPVVGGGVRASPPHPQRRTCGPCAASACARRSPPPAAAPAAPVPCLDGAASMPTPLWEWCRTWQRGTECRAEQKIPPDVTLFLSSNNNNSCFFLVLPIHCAGQGFVRLFAPPLGPLRKHVLLAYRRLQAAARGYCRRARAHPRHPRRASRVGGAAHWLGGRRSQHA